jgi:3-methyladenine DNA glycosylase AlkC
VAEALTDRLGEWMPRRIAEMTAAADPRFDAAAFLAEALAGYEALGLTARGRHVAHALRRALPEDYEDAVQTMLRSLGPPIDEAALTGMEPFLSMPHAFLVAEYGLGHFEASMRAQHAITQRFTAEFSIRPFLEHHRDRTLARLEAWTADPSPHVRRLVSEGTRPRLPWAPRLRAFQRDPSPVLALLERLKDDPERYVQRSVANNLNDIGKDHPEVLVAVCRAWADGAPAGRAWLVRHALRSAVKRGDAGAIAVLGYGEGPAPRVVEVRAEPASPRIGGRVTIAVAVAAPPGEGARAVVDLRVHFVRARGGTSPRVFKLARVDLAPGERRLLRTGISLAQHSTRTHHPGEHRVEVLVNGRPHPGTTFTLRAG